MIGGLISAALSSGLDRVGGNGLIAGALCTGVKKQPMIIKINVINAGTSEVYLTALSASYSGVNPVTYYNLKNANGEKISKETFPEMFWDKPYNGTDENKKYRLSENMTENVPGLYLEIDWGDKNEEGEKNIEKFSAREYKTTINGESFTYENITNSYKQFKHTYTQTGEFIITVRGYIDNLAIGTGFYYGKNKNNSSNKSENWKLTDVISWGDLNFKALAGTLATVISDMNFVPKLDFKYWKKVVSICWIASYWDEGEVWNDEKHGLKIDWKDIGGDGFFSNFPNLTVAYDAFYQSTISYIPEYCFKNNPHIINLDGCFYNCELKYIGQYAFADLKYLTSARQIVGLNRSKSYNKRTAVADVAEYIKENQLLQYIGDSAFENCVNLTDSGTFLNQLFMVNCELLYGKGWEKIGNRVFKNCKSLVSQNGNSVGWIYLTEIGDEVFAGCENLQSLTYMFCGAFNLKHIGNNFFKDCKNLKDTTCTFWFNLFKLDIPEKFFYDVEYSAGSYNLGFYIDTFPTSNDLKPDTDVIDFIAGHTSTFPREHQELFRILRPELCQELQQKFDEGYKQYSGYNFGKNMFNEEFLAQLGQNGGRLVNQLDCYNGKFHVYTYDENEKLIDMELYNRNTGEIPPFWKYGISARVGEIGANAERDGVYYHGDLRYDNSEEVPKEEPWVTVYPIK